MCVGCDQSVTENAKHLLMYCNKYNDKKNRYFPNMNAKLEIDNTDMTINNLSKKLLGVDGYTFGRKITNNINKTIKYLVIILPNRATTIAERKSDNTNKVVSNN